MVVHGDDFTFSAEENELLKIKNKMEEWYEIKFRGIMGSALKDIKEIIIFGRMLRWTEDGLEYIADEKLRQELMKSTGIGESANGAVGPAVKDDDEEEEEKPGKADARQYRADAARMNYLAQDRSDVQYAAKEICTCMSNPTTRGMRKLKRAVGYSAKAKQVAWHMNEIEEMPFFIDVHVDSDWAGCKTTRRSTSGGMLDVGGVVVKSWSRAQKSLALSQEKRSITRWLAETQNLLACKRWRRTSAGA